MVDPIIPIPTPNKVSLILECSGGVSIMRCFDVTKLMFPPLLILVDSVVHPLFIVAALTHVFPFNLLGSAPSISQRQWRSADSCKA